MGETNKPFHPWSFLELNSCSREQIPKQFEGQFHLGTPFAQPHAALNVNASADAFASKNRNNEKNHLHLKGVQNDRESPIGPKEFRR
jgi:hypothetical protein